MMNKIKNYSPNFSHQKRHKKKIKFIILHYTGMKKEIEAIKRLQDPKSKVSCHYLVKENGEILVLVPDLYEAWHAGLSSWKNYKSLNKDSLGIEITNPGHQNIYKNFSSKQIFSIQKLLKYLMKKYKIKKNNVLGHSDISPDRKKDPGEKFPWEKLSKKSLVLWHKLNTKKIEKFRGVKISSKLENDLFLRNLNVIGYNQLKNLNLSKNKKFLTKAFQRRFRQDLINGIIDKECYLISKNLVSQLR